MLPLSIDQIYYKVLYMYILASIKPSPSKSLRLLATRATEQHDHLPNDEEITVYVTGATDVPCKSFRPQPKFWHYRYLTNMLSDRLINYRDNNITNRVTRETIPIGIDRTFLFFSFFFSFQSNYCYWIITCLEFFSLFFPFYSKCKLIEYIYRYDKFLWNYFWLKWIQLNRLEISYKLRCILINSIIVGGSKDRFITSLSKIMIRHNKILSK